MKFTKDEKKLIAYAKRKILEYCKKYKAKGLFPKIFSFVLSKNGKIYEGASFESTLPECNICAERHVHVQYSTLHIVFDIAHRKRPYFLKSFNSLQTMKRDAISALLLILGLLILAPWLNDKEIHDKVLKERGWKDGTITTPDHFKNLDNETLKKMI